jgi:glycogen(starch) synthase
MRVLMSTDAVGGVWTYAVELRDALAARGVEVLLATIGPAAPPAPEIPYLRCRLEWQEDPWEDVARSGEWLAALAGELDVDVVHLNGFTHASREWPVPTLAVAHSCLLSWHEAVRGGATPAAWSGYRAKVRHGLWSAGAVVSPTRALLEQIRRLYALPRLGSVIPNGIAPAAAARRGERQPLVLGAGRAWDEAKGLATLAQAAAELPWPVELAGDAGATALEGLHALGALPRAGLRERMRCASIFAHPALYEPFGLAPLEAAQSGCALVLGDIPSLRELWDGAARFVEPVSKRALASALRELIEDDAERGRLAALASARAAAYDPARMAESYEHAYSRLTKRTSVAA